jgi:hypothetical protein
MTAGPSDFEMLYRPASPFEPVSDNGHGAAAKGKLAPCWAIGTAGPGAPGATTLAVALATHSDALLIEADADGGVLGPRYRCWLHDAAPSLASLLASLRPGVTAAAVDDHIQRLPAGGRALLVAPIAEEAVGPVQHLGERLAALRALLVRERLVVDVGRLRPDSAALELARQADALVLVTGSSVEALACLLARLPTLPSQVRRLVVAVRGEGPYRFADIRAEVHARAGRALPVASVPEDPRGVARLSGAPRAGRGPTQLKRSPLMQSVTALVEVLAAPPAAHAGDGLPTPRRVES